MNNIKKNSQDYLLILINILKKSHVSQRKLAQECGFSLGKLNYCIKELHKKGLIKIKNFNKNKKKSNYLYFLTPQGLSLKTKLINDFMKKKLKEYDELKLIIDDKYTTEHKKQPLKKIDHNLL